MSSMSFMEKLLDGVEVKWTALGDVCEKISSGKNKVKSDDGVYPVFGSTGIIGWTNNKVYEKEQILVARVGANAGRVNIAKGEYDVSDNTLIVKNNECIILKYLYYYLVNINLNRFAQGAGQPLITGGQLKEIQIPIPCPENPEKSLEIQAEIVRILDTFTELTTELKAELTARKKQYNYYRDQLLSFEEGEVEWKTLGEVANIKNGKDWKSLGTGDIPVYGSGGVMQYVDTFAYDKPTVLIPRKGSITNIFYVDSPFWNVDTIYYTEIDTDQIIPKFFYYFMKTIDMMQLDTGSGRPSLTQPILNQIKVPLPTLTEQAHTVTILDKFDALTNSISEGLPREIELRQKQYEYYRDLLLSFPKPDSEVAA